MQPFNAARYLVERQVAEGNGQRTAIRVQGRSLSYVDLLEQVIRAAGGLSALGVRSEERVLLALPDGGDFVAAFLGAMWIGAVPLPLNPLLPARDLAVPMADSRARVAIAGIDLPVVDGVAVSPYSSLTQGGDRAAPDETWEDSPGFWLCTSGTTGRPKLAMHRHVDLRLAAGGYAREVLAIGPDDRCLSVAPLFHAYGLGNSLAFPLSVGATAILEPTRPPTPARVAELIQAERPTLFFAVPTFYASLLAADLPGDTFSSVRTAVSAGEPLPGDLLRRFAERFGVEILDGIGSTEMTHIYISNRRGEARPGSSGRPVSGYDLRVVDDEGDDVPAGTPGHLLVRGASVATGYWCRAEDTRGAFQGEWFRSGDVYVRAADGWYSFLGRADDMFKVGGEWVAPAEVEAVLAEHPSVLEAVVVGGTRADGLLEPVAYVVPEPDGIVNEEELKTHVHHRLAGFKRPRRVVAAEQLPKTATGKVKRAVVRGWAAQRSGAPGSSSKTVPPISTSSPGSKPAAVSALITPMSRRRSSR